MLKNKKIGIINETKLLGGCYVKALCRQGRTRKCALRA